MSIKDYEDNKGDLKVAEDLATKIYRKQLHDIHNIKDTEGYKQLKDYWERVKDSASIELQSVIPGHLELVQMKYRIANDYISFLDNLEKAPYIEQQAKKAINK